MAASDQLLIDGFLAMLRDTEEQLAAGSTGGGGLPDDQISEAHPAIEVRDVFPNIRVHERPVKMEYINAGRGNVGASDFAVKVWYQFDCVCSMSRDEPVTLDAVNGGLPISNYRALIQLQHDMTDIVLRNWPALVTDATRVGTLQFVDQQLIESPDVGNVWRGVSSFVLARKHLWI